MSALCCTIVSLQHDLTADLIRIRNPEKFDSMKNCTSVLRAVLCALVMLATNTSDAQTPPFTHQGITASTGDFLGFLQYKPADYDQHPDTRYPLIIFLHGIGERGNGTTDLDRVAYVGLPRIIYKGNPMKFTWNGKTETFLVLAPQCPLKYGMWPSAFINDLLAYAKQNLHVDTNRIYLTGLSMGGGGSLRYISDALPTNPQNLAAVATIAAPCTFRTGQFAAAAHLPVWCFHAEDDSTALVQCTKNAIAGLNQWNLSPKPLLDLWPTGGHVVWDRVYTDTDYRYQGVVNIYEWFLGQNKSLPVNKLPLANAGADRSVAGTSFTLDASGSSDADGRIVRFVWKKMAGPGPVVVAAPRSSQPVTTVSGINVPGVYTFELAVVDDRAAFTRDTVSITVTSTAVAGPVPTPDSTGTGATTPANKPPLANAGKDVTLTTAWTRPLLNGTLSTDSDGWIVKARWFKVSGPVKFTILDSTALQTRAVDLDTGVYVFRLLITDNKGGTSTDDIMITVLPAPVPVAVKPPNLAPIANAGADAVATLGWNRTLLNATLSKDPDGWITRVQWTKLSGPAAYRFVDSTALQTYVTDLVEGEYMFRVRVNDNLGDSSTDDVKVTVVKRPSVATNAMLLRADEATAKMSQLTAHPNPAIDHVQVELTGPATGNTFITLYDLGGHAMKTITFAKPGPAITGQIDLHDLVRGVYLLAARTGDHIYRTLCIAKQ